MKAVEKDIELRVESSVEVKPLANAEIQLGWTALLEGYRNFWFGHGATYEQIRLFTGVNPQHFVNCGWIVVGHCPERRYFAANQLAIELCQPETCNLHPETVHVSTYPTPHIVHEFPASQPTTPERSTARQAQSGSSQTAMTESAAIGLGVQTDAAASAPSTVARRGGRWDANPVESGKELSVESPVTRELAEVIGVLKVSSDSVRERLMEITIDQQDAGWPERTQVNNAVAHLRRLASDLFNELADFELKSKMHFARNGGAR